MRGEMQMVQEQCLTKVGARGAAQAQSESEVDLKLRLAQGLVLARSNRRVDTPE